MGIAQKAEAGCDVDDGTAFATGHDSRRGTRSKEETLHVHRERIVPMLFAGSLDGFLVFYAGVIDQDIDAPERVHNPLYHVED